MKLLVSTVRFFTQKTFSFFDLWLVFYVAGMLSDKEYTAAAITAILGSVVSVALTSWSGNCRNESK